MPEIDSEELKKTIIFFEYNIRTKDPSLGNIYKENLEAFYDRIKVKIFIYFQEILSLTTDSLTKVNKQNNKN